MIVMKIVTLELFRSQHIVLYQSWYMLSCCVIPSYTFCSILETENQPILGHRRPQAAACGFQNYPGEIFTEVVVVDDLTPETALDPSHHGRRQVNYFPYFI